LRDVNILSSGGFFGTDGIIGSLTFAGQNKIGVATRLEQGQSLEVLIQDNLSSLPSFKMVAEGHEVDFSKSDGLPLLQNITSTIQTSTQDTEETKMYLFVLVAFAIGILLYFAGQYTKNYFVSLSGGLWYIFTGILGVYSFGTIGVWTIGFFVVLGLGMIWGSIVQIYGAASGEKSEDD
jgi:hypothetical protein